MEKIWACKQPRQRYGLQKFAEITGKRIARYGLPGLLARLTSTKFWERPTRIDREWVFPPNLKARRN